MDIRGRGRSLGHRILIAGSSSLLCLLFAQPLQAVSHPSEEVASSQPAGDPAQGLPDEPSDASTLSYAPGQLIVKYKSSVTQCVHCLLKRRQAIQPATTDASDSLDHLHARHHVSGARSVFRTEAEEARLSGTSLFQLQQHHRQQLARVKAKFFGRTHRAPKGAVLPDLSHIYVLEVPEDSDIEAAVDAFRQDPHVEYAQPNYTAEVQLIPNDPYYSSSGSWGQDYDDLWGLKADKLDMEPAWDLTQGEGIIVAVVDTGLDYNHPDIADNVWTNPGEIPDNGLDDDVNGYIDDVRGWDFSSGDIPTDDDEDEGEALPVQTLSKGDNDPFDDHGHGTHVAGTIAAVGNNNEGIIGVAPQATIMPLKGLGATGGGFSEHLASAIVYAARNGADVINNSWGCGGRCPSHPIAEDAVLTAYGLGVVVVFAAGNSADDVGFYSPANMPETIALAASDHLDQRASFSNFGYLLDIAAPGGESSGEYEPSSILSLQAKDTSLGPVVADGYIRLRGTSMAAPHAAGVAALVLAYRPSFTNEEIRQVLRAAADDIGAPGFDEETGAGRLDASASLAVDSVLRVKITSPATGEFFDLSSVSSITVTGTAAGGNFKQYQLFVAQDSSAPEWLPLGDPVFTAIEEDILGSWEMDELTTGSYILRLVATATTGLEFEAFVRVALEDATHIRQITSDPLGQEAPSISGGYIVWQDGRNPGGYPGVSWDVFLYDLTTGFERELIVKQSRQYAPAISGDRIAYLDDDFPPPPGKSFIPSEVFVYDLQTDRAWQISDQQTSQDSPDISNDRIVFNRMYHCLFDTATGACPQEVFTPEILQFSSFSSISGDRIVYSGSIDSEGNRVLFVYDTATEKTHRITSEEARPYMPVISGDRVAWFDTRSKTGRYDVYLYDLHGIHAGTERLIAQDVLSVGTVIPIDDLAISGDWIVWEGDRSGNLDIYLYDLATDTEHQITGHPGDSYNPAVSGNRIVWQDTRDKTDALPWNTNVYMYDLNQAPVLDPIGDQTISEGASLTFSVTASDPDGDALTLTAELVSGDPLSSIGATFTDHGDGTGTFTWAPGSDQLGRHFILFAVSDGELGDAETITIADRVYQPPVASIQADPTEGSSPLTVHFDGSGSSDPDGDDLTYTWDFGDGTAEETGAVVSHTYTMPRDFTARLTVSDGIFFDTAEVFVEAWFNRKPSLAVQDSDVTDDGLVDAADVTRITDALGSTPGDAAYEVALDLKPDDVIDEQDLSLVQKALGLEWRSTLNTYLDNLAAGRTLVFYLRGSDPDPDDTLTYRAVVIPAGATFDKTTQRFEWTPTEGQVGRTYSAWFHVDDGVFIDSHTVNITVTSPNQPPVLTPIGDQTISEGALLTVPVTASDPDGDALTLTAELADGDPLSAIGATFADSGDGTGTFTWTPRSDQVGSHEILFTVSDWELADTEPITITVLDTTPPVVTITAPTDGATVSSDGFQFTGTAEDPSEVAEVRIYVYDYGRGAYTVANAVAIYSGATETWSFSVLAGHVSPGSNARLWVRAKDTQGNASNWQSRLVSVADTTPPVVRITAPADGATVSSEGFQFTGTAEDASGVAEVRIYVYDYGRGAYTVSNALASYSGSTEIWSYSVLAGHVSPGSNARLWVRAKDTTGNRSWWQSRLVSVAAADTTPPVVTITAPTDGATVSPEGFQFTGTAEDASGVTEVRIYVYDYGRGTYTVANALASYSGSGETWSYSVLAGHVSPGSNARLWVRARDPTGNWSWWQSRLVSVAAADTTPPVVTITAPTDGATVSSGGFLFTGTAEDPSGVAEARIYVYDYGRGTFTVVNALASYSGSGETWSYSVLAGHVSAGSRARLWVRAKDTQGYWSSWQSHLVTAQ